MVRSVRASHSSSNAVDSKGSAPGWPVTSSTRASTSCRLDCYSVALRPVG